MMRIAAVIAVREGTEYLHNCLTYLQANTIKALIIDNGLSGPGRRIVESARYSDTVAAVEELPARDVFCLDDQLLKKEEMIRSFDGDWVIHHDIDELLQSDREGESLRDAILRADRSGANAINFLEMVFIPCDAPYATTPDGWPETLSYYHFAPAPYRLMRARKTAASLSMLPTSGRTGQGGGHLLFGDALILHQSNFFLRHYIVTDQAHARRKYVERRFSESEVARGWHRNRIGFSPGAFAFPDAGRLKRLPHRHSAAFDLSEPHKDHYWQWSPRDEAGR